MNVRQLNVFAEAVLDNSIKLAVARDLERLYAPLVGEPIPPPARERDFVLRCRLGGHSEAGVRHG